MQEEDQSQVKPDPSDANRIAVLETDLRSLKNSLAVIGPSVALALGLLGIALAWNTTSERQDLRNFQTDVRDEIKAKLGQATDEPDLVISTPDGHSFDGVVVEPTISTNESQKAISVPSILHNHGKGWTGENIAIKVYTPAGIPMIYRATDEPGYAFEDYWIGAKAATGIDNLPGGFTTVFNFAMYLQQSQTIEPGRYNCLVKVYYGRGKIARANFVLNIKAQH